MKTKTIQIPIYRGTLRMYYAKDLTPLEIKYNLKSTENYGAVVLTNETKYKQYVVAFKYRNDLSLIAHEVVHLVNRIFLDCGQELDRVNDEAQAYLTGFLFNEIDKFLLTCPD